MSIHRVTLLLDVDDELLAEHVTENEGKKPPYTTLVSEWDAADIIRAVEEDIIDPHACEVELYHGTIGNA